MTFESIDQKLADINTLECDADATPEQEALAMQRMINSGLAWRMQGSYGRAAMDALEAGFCMLGTERRTDYYGNRIPARDDVQEGTKGSRGNVVEQRGEEWAVMLEGA